MYPYLDIPKLLYYNTFSFTQAEYIMILRDIFSELAEIFGFCYEKNKNGSYRVNTVIRALVYPELYTLHEFSEAQIGYFLKDPEVSYQNYPNIRNSFSELMNPREHSTRFPIEEFAGMIDIHQMYDYYAGLIKGLDSEKTMRLRRLIDDIFVKEAVLHTELKQICREIHEFIVWILLFSMFHKSISEEKLQSFICSEQKISQRISVSESSALHQLSLLLQKSNSRLTVLNTILLSLVGLQFVLAFLPNFLPAAFSRLSKTQTNLYYIWILMYSCIVMSFWIYHVFETYKVKNLRTMYDFKNDFAELSESSELLAAVLRQGKLPSSDRNDRMTPIQSECASQKRRKRFRRFLTGITLLLCVASIIPSIIAESLPLLAAFISVWIMGSLCVDRLLNDHRIRIAYDSLSENAGVRLKSYRGLAKIYRWEYEKTGFDLKDPYYNNAIPIHSKECYQNIFSMAYDRIRWSLLNRYLVLIYINILLIVLVGLQNLIGDTSRYFRLPAQTDVNLFVMIYLFLAGTFCIIVALTNDSRFHELSLLVQSGAHIEKHPEDAERIFISLQGDNIIRGIDSARGIFIYNLEQFEKSIKTEDIFPESDRMLFFHRSITLRSFAVILLIFFYAIALALLVWHTQRYGLFFPVTGVALILYVLTMRFFPNRIHRKKIIREIKKLGS